MDPNFSHIIIGCLLFVTGLRGGVLGAAGHGLAAAAGAARQLPRGVGEQRRAPHRRGPAR